jgi:hypothetical protein
MSSGYEDTLRRNQSYRVLKSQPSEPSAPRYLERASVADANVYAAPLSIATRTPEPVAFLTTDFEIARVSPSFADAVGSQNLKGRRLVEVLASSERDKTHGHQRQMQDEQTRKEPNYLPPIYAKQVEDRVIQVQGFSTDDISRFQLDLTDVLTFAAADGAPRTFRIRMGLVKQESIYFIVLQLILAPRFPYPSPSPHGRDIPYQYHQPTQHAPQQQAFTQHTPVSATFDPARTRFDPGMAPRQGGAPPSQVSGLSPGISPGIPSYAPSPSRPDYPLGPSTYQVPRSELQQPPRHGRQQLQQQPPPPPPPQQQPPQPSYQLPPIRAQPQQTTANTETSWGRDERPNRVDIGGLIDKPEQQQRRQ